MNRRLTSGWSGFAIATFLGGFLISGADAAKLPLSKKLDGDEARCLNQLFPLSSYSHAPREEQRQLAAVAKAGRTDLGDKGSDDYFFLFEDIGWCGSGGCLLMIGERRHGTCHLLYEGAGDTITVLQARDHGYRRIYASCELRFDGQEYQQVHPDCPTLDVQH